MENNKEAYADGDGVHTLEFPVVPRCNSRETSKVVPEIVEIEEEGDDECCKGVSDQRRENSSTASGRDVYVAVGKDDLVLLKWVLANGVVDGDRVNLVHVFPPISSISTPVGRLWVGQLSLEQAKVFAIEEHNKRKNLLHKYIRLCVENKVNVDTILIESNETTKAISDLIPVLDMTSLVMGTKHPPSSRRLIKGSSRGTSIQKNAPEYCKVTLVYTGKKYADNQGKIYQSSLLASNEKKSKVNRQKYNRNNKQECACFPVKF